MNSLERIVAAVNFQEHDRVPVVPLVFGHAAILGGIPLQQYLTDGETLARCQLGSLGRYGYDAVFAFMDACVEAEAMGAAIVSREGMYPTIGRYVVDSAADIEHLSVPDPQAAGRMPEVLKAASLLKQEVGSEVLVAGLVLGPATLALQLMGPEKALFLAADDPAGFAALLDFCTGVAIRFGVAQIEAGVHLPIMFEPAASGEVIPPAIYRERILPCIARVFSSYIAAGAAANLLHIAGRLTGIIGLFPEAGAHIAGIDYPVSIDDAIRALPQTCILGNIKPYAFVDETPQQIEAKAARLVKACAKRGGFILSGGCELPLETKPENLDALVRAARLPAGKAA